jgi:hypothetical protein
MWQAQYVKKAQSVDSMCLSRSFVLSSCPFASLKLLLGAALQACLLFCSVNTSFLKDFVFRRHTFSIIAVPEVSRVR